MSLQSLVWCLSSYRCHPCPSCAATPAFHSWLVVIYHATCCSAAAESRIMYVEIRGVSATQLQISCRAQQALQVTSLASVCNQRSWLVSITANGMPLNMQATGASKRVFELMDRVTKQPPAGIMKPSGNPQGGEVELRDIWWALHCCCCVACTALNMAVIGLMMCIRLLDMLLRTTNTTIWPYSAPAHVRVEQANVV